MQYISKQQTIDILSGAFTQNRTAKATLKSEEDQHFYNLFNFVYEYAKGVGEIFVSEDKTNVMIYFQKRRLRLNFHSLFLLGRLILFSVNWHKMYQHIKVLNRISKIRKLMIQENNYNDFIHVWFLAKGHNTKGYAGLHQIMTHLKRESLEKRIPVFLETTNERLIPIYNRAGFCFYHDEKIRDQTIWFGKFNSVEQL